MKPSSSKKNLDFLCLTAYNVCNKGKRIMGRVTKTVHVGIPYTVGVACGAPGYYATAMYREGVTCRLCKKTEYYKNLKSLPRKFRK